jgi:hypothetical protein
MTEKYIFTGFFPSGNPFLWYYDENKRTSFATSIQVESWDAKPKIGDTIEIEKSGRFNETTEKVFINGEVVYRRSQEKEREIQKRNDDITNKQLEALGVDFRL